MNVISRAKPSQKVICHGWNGRFMVTESTLLLPSRMAPLPDPSLRRLRWRLSALLKSGQLPTEPTYPLRNGGLGDAASFAQVLLALADKIQQTPESERDDAWQERWRVVARDLVELEKWVRRTRKDG